MKLITFCSASCNAGLTRLPLARLALAFTAFQVLFGFAQQCFDTLQRKSLLLKLCTELLIRCIATGGLRTRPIRNVTSFQSAHTQCDNSDSSRGRHHQHGVVRHESTTGTPRNVPQPFEFLPARHRTLFEQFDPNVAAGPPRSHRSLIAMTAMPAMPAPLPPGCTRTVLAMCSRRSCSLTCHNVEFSLAVDMACNQCPRHSALARSFRKIQKVPDCHHLFADASVRGHPSVLARVTHCEVTWSRALLFVGTLTRASFPAAPSHQLR